MSIVAENQVFPCIDYLKKIAEVRYIKIEKYEYFKKATFRNRYIIATANGVSSLTVPVAGGREQKTLITEIEIDNMTDWRTKHWRSITSAYRKAPFFDYYADEIKSLIYKSESCLFNFNISILDSVLKLLNINTNIDFTETYSSYPFGEDFRDKLLPKSFQDEGIGWQPKYSQVFEDRIGFQPNLSILDLLFCEGPNSLNLIEQSIKERR